MCCVPVKFSFWFNSYINPQTSVELTADKIHNLLTKQELEVPIIETCMNYKKNCHLNYHMNGANRKTTFSK